MNYEEFLNSKVAIAKESGFETKELNPALFPHQADSVRWALKGGRRAIFAAFGNGKTNMGLELAHQCAIHTGKQSLIICPLGVKQEFEHDAREILGYKPPRCEGHHREDQRNGGLIRERDTFPREAG